MKTQCLATTLVGLMLSSAPAAAADLRKIDRHLAKEPPYHTQLPKYGLLVFGPEADTRVWLVIDGDVLYLDRDGTGDLTEPAKRVAGRRSGKWLDFQAGPITTAHGKRRDLRLRIRDFQVADGRCTGMDIIVNGTHKQFVGYDEANPFRFAQRPGQAPVLHLQGPLQMTLYGEPPTFVAGREVDLNIAIGTPGVGPGSFCAIACCTVLDCKVSPVAEIEFPARNPDAILPPTRVSIADD
jgi:hypothetical protein